MKVNFVIFLLSLVLAARAIPPWKFYYNVTAGQDQTHFNTLSTTGYWMISLSVYGQPPDHHYAAVWVQRPGPSYYAIHEASGAAYQSFFDTHAQNGYVSTIVTVTGPPSAPIFAGVMEQNGVTNWYELCGLTTTQFTTELHKAQANHYILKSFTEYGSPSDRRYCGVWYDNDQLEDYTYFLDQSYAESQDTFNSQTQKFLRRPSYFSVSEDHQISSTYVDNDVGPWLALQGTADDLQSVNADQQAAGRYIIHLQGGGTGSNAHFAALWATQDIPTRRVR